MEAEVVYKTPINAFRVTLRCPTENCREEFTVDLAVDKKYVMCDTCCEILTVDLT